MIEFKTKTCWELVNLILIRPQSYDIDEAYNTDSSQDFSGKYFPLPPNPFLWFLNLLHVSLATWQSFDLP